MVSSPEESGGLLPPGFLYEREVEPVGRFFLNQWDRLQSNRTISAGFASDSDDDVEDGEDDELFEDDLDYLRSLDPKEVNEQDHYKVLGLTNIRIKATDEQIKRAHRQKVLKHHPDKRKHAGEEVREDDDYFTCITKAFEILGNPVRRRAFDSVDPLFEDSVPKVINDKEQQQQEFYSVFGPVFLSNSRWSNKTPVPLLGDDSSTREDVESFYSFWYDFDSWREYSYLDEEDKEKASDKWERREIDKVNKAQRLERKKEENKRMRKLVDNAYNSDPRILRFREEEKQEKAAKKKAKQDAVRARKEEEEREKREQEEKERKEREEAEAAEKVKQEAEKKEREMQKKLIKNEKKKFRTIAKDQNMFTDDDNLRVKHMSEVEKICETSTIDQLRALNERLAGAGGDTAAVWSVFLAEVDRMNVALGKERAKTEVSRTGPTSEKSANSAKEWNSDDLQLLIKAVNLFPAGTNQRWEVVAEFINQHTKNQNEKKNAKETLAQAKKMQNSDFSMNSLKEEVNKMAYQNLEKAKKREVVVESEASERTETAAEAQGFNNAPWTPDEQKLLEQALKTYPTSTPERWERISESIPGRSKKDCMKRYKELAELIRAKKAAQAAAKKA